MLQNQRQRNASYSNVDAGAEAKLRNYNKNEDLVDLYQTERESEYERTTQVQHN